MFYLGFLLLGGGGVRRERWAFLYGRRGEGSLFEQLPLPQQAGVHDSATGKRREKRVGVNKAFRSRNICITEHAELDGTNRVPSLSPTLGPTRTPQESHSGPGSVVQTLRELCQDWCCDHIPGEQFIPCLLLLFPSMDLNNRVKVSAHHRHPKECEWECRTSPHGRTRVGKPGTKLTRDLTATGRTEQSGSTGGRVTGNHRPEGAGASPPRYARTERGSRSPAPLPAPVPLPILAPAPGPLTAPPARARSPDRKSVV